MKGNHRRIYNFDDHAEFEEAADAPKIDEKLISDCHQDDVHIPDADYEEYETWATAARNQQPQENQN